MRDRPASMRRILALQGKVVRLADYEVARAEAADREIEAAARDLDAFAGEAPLSGKLSGLVTAQRRRLAARKALAEQRVETCRSEAQDAKGRLKLAERLKRSVDDEARRETERKDLERLLDAMASPRDGA